MVSCGKAHRNKIVHTRINTVPASFLHPEVVLQTSVIGTDILVLQKQVTGEVQVQVMACLELMVSAFPPHGTKTSPRRCRSLSFCLGSVVFGIRNRGSSEVGASAGSRVRAMQTRSGMVFLGRLGMSSDLRCRIHAEPSCWEIRTRCSHAKRLRRALGVYLGKVTPGKALVMGNK
jgi:hypothetical protein